jgi:hypothetical protein
MNRQLIVNIARNAKNPKKSHLVLQMVSPPQQIRSVEYHVTDQSWENLPALSIIKTVLAHLLETHQGYQHFRRRTEAMPRLPPVCILARNDTSQVASSLTSPTRSYSLRSYLPAVTNSLCLFHPHPTPRVHSNRPMFQQHQRPISQ